MRDTTDSTMEEDIGEISLETTIPKPRSADWSAAQRKQGTSGERFENATRSHHEWLRARWVRGESPRQIARETGYEVDVIYQMLRDMQRAINKA